MEEILASRLSGKATPKTVQPDEVSKTVFHPCPVERCVLLLDPDPDRGKTRELLLATLGHPVHVARSGADVCHLSRQTRYSLAAVSLFPRPKDLYSTLTTIRNAWPKAQILLLGASADGVEDYQYDEIVNAAQDPAEFVEIARRLISGQSGPRRS